MRRRYKIEDYLNFKHTLESLLTLDNDYIKSLYNESYYQIQEEDIKPFTMYDMLNNLRYNKEVLDLNPDIKEIVDRSNKILPDNSRVYICETPIILSLCNLNKYSIIDTTKRILIKTQTKNEDHTVKDETLLNLKSLIENPICIIKSKTEGIFVFIVDDKNSIGNYLLIPISEYTNNNKGIYVNQIDSIYGRNKLKSYLEKIYIFAFHKIKMNDLLSELRDTMPMCDNTKSFIYDDSITKTLDNVKQNGKEIFKNLEEKTMLNAKERIKETICNDLNDNTYDNAITLDQKIVCEYESLLDTYKNDINNDKGVGYFAAQGAGLGLFVDNTVLRNEYYPNYQGDVSEKYYLDCSKVFDELYSESKGKLRIIDNSIKKDIAEYIKRFESYKGLFSEKTVEFYKYYEKEFKESHVLGDYKGVGYNLAKDGNFIVYYDDIKSFYNLDIKYTDEDSKLFERYCQDVNKAMKEMYDEAELKVLLLENVDNKDLFLPYKDEYIGLLKKYNVYTEEQIEKLKKLDDEKFDVWAKAFWDNPYMELPAKCIDEFNSKFVLFNENFVMKNVVENLKNNPKSYLKENCSLVTQKIDKDKSLKEQSKDEDKSKNKDGNAGRE